MAQSDLDYAWGRRANEALNALDDDALALVASDTCSDPQVRRLALRALLILTTRRVERGAPEGPDGESWPGSVEAVFEAMGEASIGAVSALASDYSLEPVPLSVARSAHLVSQFLAIPPDQRQAAIEAWQANIDAALGRMRGLLAERDRKTKAEAN
jgi:hypothetical protein